MTSDELDLSLLERLCAVPGVSGREEAVRRLVRAELEGLVDEVSVDTMGNLVAVRRGDGGPRVMLAAHMDEVGFLVKHVDDRGFVRIHPVGGIFPKFIGAQRVRIQPADGGAPVLGVLYEPSDLGLPNEETKVPKVEEFFVDVGLPGAARLSVGDAVTMDRGLERSGDRVVAKALDDRVGLFVILEVLRRLPRGRADVIVVGSVQEEIGTRGATVAAHRIAKDVAVAVDTTHARDLPGVEGSKTITRLEEGVSIKVMDRHQITNAKLVGFVRRLAEDREIPYQLEVGLPGGTDAEAIEIAGDGTPSIALSIPCRYPHTASETCDLRDVLATIRLLQAFVEELTESVLSFDV
ncbi:MAG TPA: M20/M25/M40 family metallo-hydrolase [Actinomycetota bacterium]